MWYDCSHPMGSYMGTEQNGGSWIIYRSIPDRIRLSRWIGMLAMECESSAIFLSQLYCTLEYVTLLTS